MSRLPGDVLILEQKLGRILIANWAPSVTWSLNFLRLTTKWTGAIIWVLSCSPNLNPAHSPLSIVLGLDYSKNRYDRDNNDNNNAYLHFPIGLWIAKHLINSFVLETHRSYVSFLIVLITFRKDKVTGMWNINLVSVLCVFNNSFPWQTVFRLSLAFYPRLCGSVEQAGEEKRKKHQGGLNDASGAGGEKKGGEGGQREVLETILSFPLGHTSPNQRSNGKTIGRRKVEEKVTWPPGWWTLSRWLFSI